MIAENLKRILSEIPEGVQLIVVSKTRSNEEIMEAYNAGHRIFGENRVLEMVDKHAELPDDIEWHFIGHLQRNKVKYMADFVSLIHSVDSYKLLKEVNKRARKADRTIDCLLQFHIADEEAKFGLTMDKLDFLDSGQHKELTNVRIRGVMGMATFTEDEDQVQREFQLLKSIFNQLKERYFGQNAEFADISMGMSGDYRLGIEAGSTMLRIGSDIFGPRE